MSKVILRFFTAAMFGIVAAQGIPFEYAPPICAAFVSGVMFALALDDLLELESKNRKREE